VEPDKRTNDGEENSAFEDVVRPCEFIPLNLFFIQLVWFTPLRKGRLRGVLLTFAMVSSVESVVAPLCRDRLVKLVELVELVELGKMVGEMIW